MTKPYVSKQQYWQVPQNLLDALTEAQSDRIIRDHAQRMLKVLQEIACMDPEKVPTFTDYLFGRKITTGCERAQEMIKTLNYSLRIAPDILRTLKFKQQMKMPLPKVPIPGGSGQWRRPTLPPPDPFDDGLDGVAWEPGVDATDGLGGDVS